MQSSLNVRFETRKNQVDPSFENLMHMRTSGVDVKKYHTAQEGEVPVIARVKDLARFEHLDSVSSLGAKVQDVEKKEWIVTARVPYSRFEQLSGDPSVINLTVTKPVRPLLANTVKEIGLKVDVLSKSIFEQAGEGVLIGVVDYGADFRHRNFRIGNQTRLAFLWDQGGPSNPNSPFGYGRVYEAQEINQALAQADPYSALNYSPTVGSHGTHVLDIAGGNGPAPGLAPKASLAFVELNIRSAVGPDVFENKFGDSARVIEAVKYIFDRAGNKPCVINLSLGTNGGPHDGTNGVERAFDALLKEKPNRAIVIAAANSYNDGAHTSGKLIQGSSVELSWKIPYADRTDNELEIWYPGTDEVDLEIIRPNGNSVGRIGLGVSGGIWDEIHGERKMLAFVSHRKQDPQNNDNVIHIFQNVKADFWGGTWTLKLHAKTVKSEGKFHAWIERDDAGQSTFENPDPEYTLGSLSTGHKSIVVGSYDATKKLTPISYFSSSGPTRDGRLKPEVSAPGHNVWAAKATSLDPVNDQIQKSGTSMAAPAVTGLVARIFGQALLRNKDLTIDETLKILKDTCRSNPPPAPPSHDARYGFGRISATALQHPLIGPSS